MNRGRCFYKRRPNLLEIVSDKSIKQAYAKVTVRYRATIASSQPRIILPFFLLAFTAPPVGIRARLSYVSLSRVHPWLASALGNPLKFIRKNCSRTFGNREVFSPPAGIFFRNAISSLLPSPLSSIYALVLHSLTFDLLATRTLLLRWLVPQRRPSYISYRLADFIFTVEKVKTAR